MADQADVEGAIASILANALYPSGSESLSATGETYRIYRGYPNSSALDADLLAGVTHVTITPVDGTMKDTTRFPRRWQTVAPVAKSLTVRVDGTTAEFSGSCAVGQLAGVALNGGTFAYAVQQNDTPPTVASNLAAMLRAAGWLTNYAGTTVSVPAATQFTVRVVAGAGVLQEIHRQTQEFKVALWCPDPASRDTAAPIVDAALQAQTFVALADGSSAKLLRTGGTTQDKSGDAGLYRRNLVVNVEYPTTLSETLPAMLFGVAGLSANGEFVQNFRD